MRAVVIGDTKGEIGKDRFKDTPQRQPVGIAADIQRQDQPQVFGRPSRDKLDPRVQPLGVEDTPGGGIEKGLYKIIVRDLIQAFAKITSNFMPQPAIFYPPAERPAQQQHHPAHRFFIQVNALNDILLMALPVALLKAGAGAARYPVKVVVIADKAVIDNLRAFRDQRFAGHDNRSDLP